MANIFGGLAAIVLLFTAFVANKNKKNLEDQKAVVELEERNLQTNKGRSGTLKAEIEDLTDQITTTKGDRDDFQMKLEKQKADNDKLQASTEAKSSELDDVKARVADAEDTLKTLGPVRELAPKIEALNADLAGLKDDVALANAQISRLRSDKTSTAEVASNLSKELGDRTSGRSLPSLKTSIRSISRSLGFVTLADGDNAGVVGGSKLKVMRGEDKVADLNVTAVSGGTATADIVSSSIQDGDQIFVGDKVVAAE